MSDTPIIPFQCGVTPQGGTEQFAGAHGSATLPPRVESEGAGGKTVPISTRQEVEKMLHENRDRLHAEYGYFLTDRDITFLCGSLNEADFHIRMRCVVEQGGGGGFSSPKPSLEATSPNDEAERLAENGVQKHKEREAKP